MTGCRLRTEARGPGPGATTNSKTGCAQLWLGPSLSQGYLSPSNTTQPDKQQPGSSREGCLGSPGSGEKVNCIHHNKHVQRTQQYLTLHIHIAKQSMAGNVLSLLTPCCYWELISQLTSLTRVLSRRLVSSHPAPLCGTRAAATFYPTPHSPPLSPLSLLWPGLSAAAIFIGPTSSQQIGTARTLNLINTPDCVTLICQLISK